MYDNTLASVSYPVSRIPYPVSLTIGTIAADFLSLSNRHAALTWKRDTLTIDSLEY